MTWGIVLHNLGVKLIYDPHSNWMKKCPQCGAIFQLPDYRERRFCTSMCKQFFYSKQQNRKHASPRP